MASVLVSLWAACGSLESLWVDELHTSWTLSGSLADVAPRARAGNQAPLFFWGLFALVRTLGSAGLPPELILRLPAIVSWASAVALCAWLVSTECRQIQGLKTSASPRDENLGWSTVWLFVPVAWIGLDRIQLFYASEARVYAVEQLLSLLAWLCLGRLWQEKGGRYLLPRTGPAGALHKWYLTPFSCIVAWCGLACLLLHVHVTSALSVMWQIGVGTVIVYRQDVKPKWGWWLAVLVVFVSTSCALLGSASVWQHRYQWQSFAGDATVDAFIHLFPLAAFAVPLLAWNVDWLLTKTAGGASAPMPDDVRRASRNWSSLWFVAAFGPWGVAWVMTACGIAPIFHRRYVIVSALPLVMLATVTLMRVRGVRLRWATVLGVVAWLLLSQGTLTNWRNGQWIGWQRVEDWRGATQYIQSAYQTGDEIWCASSLIEGHAATPPLSPAWNEYLSFPLRGIYRILDHRDQPVQPMALVGNSQMWSLQLVHESVLSRTTQTKAAWVVYRGRLAIFQGKLSSVQESLGERDWQVEIEETQAFGLVCVARLRLAHE